MVNEEDFTNVNKIAPVEPREIFNSDDFGQGNRKQRVKDKERKNKRREQRRARVKNR